MTPFIKKLAYTSILSAGIVACGGDDSSIFENDAGGGGGECDGQEAVTESDSGVMQLSATFRCPLTEDLTLTADKEWFLSGAFVVGDDSAETVLTIEPGTTIFGGDGSFILIQRNSKIMAEGTASAPIVMTSANEVGMRAPQDWGGLIINGNAPINNGDASGQAAGEADTGTYGGDNALDNSGVLKYLRIEFAGNQIDAENELNGIGFQGVGAGTEVDRVQIHLASDDGVEFFGGTVNVKRILVTGSDDDSIDWTGGWQGNAQFIIAEQLAESGNEAERGIEADNLEANNSAMPYSDPILSNVTLIGRSGNTADGMRLRRGTKGQLFNFIVTGFVGRCVTVTEEQTFLNIQEADLNVDNFVTNCVGGDSDDEAVPLLEGQNIISADPMLDGWQPAAGSPALGIGMSPNNDFIEQTDYAGALDGTNNWTAGWIETALN